MENATKTSGKERRFGRRHLFAGGSAFVRMHRPEDEAGHREPVKVFDFSIGGLGFFTDRRLALPKERAVIVEIGEAAIEVMVKRTRTVEGSRLAYHGAEFTEPDQATVEHLAIHVPLQPDLPEFAEVQSGSETASLWTTTLGEEWSALTVVLDDAARERALHPWPFPASDARPSMAGTERLAELIAPVRTSGMPTGDLLTIVDDLPAVVERARRPVVQAPTEPVPAEAPTVEPTVEPAAAPMPAPAADLPVTEPPTPEPVPAPAAKVAEPPSAPAAVPVAPTAVARAEPGGGLALTVSKKRPVGKGKPRPKAGTNLCVLRNPSATRQHVIVEFSVRAKDVARLEDPAIITSDGQIVTLKKRGQIVIPAVEPGASCWLLVKGTPIGFGPDETIKIVLLPAYGDTPAPPVLIGYRIGGLDELVQDNLRRHETLKARIHRQADVPWEPIDPSRTNVSSYPDALADSLKGLKRVVRGAWRSGPDPLQLQDAFRQATAAVKAGKPANLAVVHARLLNQLDAVGA